MTEKDNIHKALPKFLRTGTYDIVIPNFYCGRYEMDVFKLTQAGYIIEYEIKTTRSDFLRDAKKGHSVYRGVERTSITKHEHIAKGDGMCNRFYFVVPENLIPVTDCPDFAGLIYHTQYGFEIVKTGKLLHKRTGKIDMKTVARKLMFREEMWRDKYTRMMRAQKNKQDGRI